MDVKLLTKDADYEAVLNVMLQLRTSYDYFSLAQQIEKQQENGYQIVYVKSGEDILGVAGFVIGEKLAWGKHIYIDDLVTNTSSRSHGVGACLMKWFKEYATATGCQQIHLDSGVQRFSAHKFYLREGFKIASHHFSLTD
ncbi:GNAT family N-acetyltransferase [Veronia pacifica]|uniref:GCN5 family acetyltransferase n=1 Tax=Veronia pacifica TaxID=1080227 RepID=A0A1C3EBK7_9GAMM|nr:GNAT family N-acetyltransferase [Veronia pacifica]ODA30608.1 GCN5 family acetyltransferase [Veronia pacifica]